MCFSATASFVTGAALVPTGIWCLRRAAKADPDARPLAAIPVGFGVQQLLEGLVWVGLGRGDEALARAGALGFLFFAIVFWPFWIPWSGSCLERGPGSRRVLRFAAIAGLGVSLSVYLPLLAHAPGALQSGILHHSIRYEIELAAPLRVVPLAIWQIGYVILAATPLVFAGAGRYRLFGILLLVSAVTTQAVFWHAFISIWCAFAAVLSMSLAGLLAAPARPRVRARALSASARAGVLLASGLLGAAGGGAAVAGELATAGRVHPVAPAGPAAAPGPVAPVGPSLGRFHVWLKGGRADLASGGREWGIDRIGYLAIEGFRGNAADDYGGLEFGRFERDEATDPDGALLRDVDSYWLETNWKHAFRLRHGLSFDAGAGGAFFFIEGDEVTTDGGVEFSDPLADIGFGLQVFGDFNWRVRRLLIGVDVKYQVAFDVFDIDYSNLRAGAHLGLAF